MCTFCNRFKEDIEHLLFHCPLPLSFWRGFEAFWNINMNEILNLSVQHIIVGISNETSQLLNYCILVGKFTIFQFRKNNMKLSLELLKVKLIQRYSKEIFIAKISMTSPIVINVPTRVLLAGETKGSLVWWLANLNIKRNLTSMFVNKYLP